MPELPFAKKSLGQHWLNDPASLSAMCAAAQVTADDYVLEIGPGAGTLTDVLLATGATVHAVEFDDSLLPALRQKFTQHIKSGHLRIGQGDIRTFDLTLLPPDYKIVANIPYYLTSNLVQIMSESANPPTVAALLVQKEVAERLAAHPGDMSLLSVTAQFYWDVRPAEAVPARLFTPPPKVDSQIVVLQRRTELLLADSDVKNFFRLVKAGYSQRRKTLLNSLSSGLLLDKEAVQSYCKAANIIPSRRPQTLSIEEWHNLYLIINT